MKHDLTRRGFLAASAAAGASLMGARRLDAAPFKTTLHKALIGAPSEETLKSWKDAGFEGMESNKWDVTPAEAAAGRKIAEKLGMQIHSVLRGWTNFNSPPAPRRCTPFAAHGFYGHDGPAMAAILAFIR